MQKKNFGLGVKLEIAEGLEKTIKFFVVATQPNLSGFEFCGKIKIFMETPFVLL